MKKLVVLVLAVMLFCGASYYEHNYTRKNCEIVNVEDGVATFVDECGYSWKWEIEENEYFEIGDFVDLRMNDHNTNNNIFDDEITKIIFHD